MQIIQQLAVNSDCYKANQHIIPQGIVIHSVGCNQPNASVFANTWNRPGQRACVHAVLDNNGLVIQCLPWDMRGWHVGGAANNTHIGVEMTEPSTIKYVGGANWIETGDGSNTAAHVLGTYRTAVELFAALCNLYHLDPLKDGVIISHREAHLRGLGSNHGDVEHLWNKYGLTMVAFRQDIYNKMKELGYIPTIQQENNMNNLTVIMGKAVATPEQIKSVMRKNNVKTEYVDLVDTYFVEGDAEGVRPDILLAQSNLETGWFTFKGDVVPEQNNFAGLGTIGGGVKGCYFSTPQKGIRVQVQHLKAYASIEPLKQDKIDPRFDLVQRGCAPYVEWLGQKENPQGRGWASGKDYGYKIMNLLNSFINEQVITQPAEGTEDSEVVKPTQPIVTPTAKYVARLEFDKPDTQIGCYNQLNNAILKVEEVTPYKIFSSETGEVIYKSCFARLGRPKAFTIIVNKQISAYVEPYGKQATLINEGEYEASLTYSKYCLVLGIGWVDLSEVKIKSDKIEVDKEEEVEGVPYTYSNGNSTVFTQKEWDSLIKLWAYTGAAEELIGHHSVQELRTVLQNI